MSAAGREWQNLIYVIYIEPVSSNRKARKMDFGRATLPQLLIFKQTHKHTKILQILIPYYIFWTFVSHEFSKQSNKIDQEISEQKNLRNDVSAIIPSRQAIR